MVVAYYILGAAVAAWMTTGSSGVDWKLSILVLPLMFFAHFGYKAAGGGRRMRSAGASPKQRCLNCGNAIGICRGLAGHRFCSADHERAYLAELEELAVQRLRAACSAVPVWMPSAPLTSVGNQPAALPRPEPDQTLALMVRPKAAFSPSPAYPGAM